MKENVFIIYGADSREAAPGDVGMCLSMTASVFRGNEPGKVAVGWTFMCKDQLGSPNFYFDFPV